MNGSMSEAMKLATDNAPLDKRRTMGVGRVSVIRAALDRLKIHPAELADFLGISGSAMDNYLSGGGAPPYMIEIACAGLIAQLDNAAAARAFIEQQRITGQAPVAPPPPPDSILLIRVPPDKAAAVATVLDAMKIKVATV